MLNNIPALQDRVALRSIYGPGYDVWLSTSACQKWQSAVPSTRQRGVHLYQNRILQEARLYKDAEK